MRKILLLMWALLTLGASGAWATTTPNILAYPESGKVYYIAGYYDNSGEPLTAYLYANGSSLAANVSYTKNGAFAYLWLCKKSENGYTFQNLSTGTYLKGPGTSANPSLNATGTDFDLYDEVQNADCISFTTGTGNDKRWAAVNFTDGSPNRLTGSYNYTPISNKYWTTDFLLEEYAAQTLSHNQYYYIYCDNDENGSTTGGDDIRQYLYNTSPSATIPVQKDESQVSLTNYAWRAQQLSTDHFSFKNGSKYLAFHSLSDAAFDWNTNYVAVKNSVERGVGRVRLWGNRSGSGNRYMLVNYSDATATASGGFADGIGSSVAKGTSNWSPEYIFRIAPQTDVYKVAIKVEAPSDVAAVFIFDGIDYSGDSYIYVDGNNLPGTKNISLKSSNSAYTFKGFYLEDGTSLGTTIDVSALTANKGVKAIFYPFKLSANFASANWYYMTVNGEYAVAVEPNPMVEEAYPPYPMYETKQISENALWAFVDNSGDGFFIVNYAKGDAKKLDLYTPATFETTNGYTKCYHLWDGDNVYIYNSPSDPWYLIDNSTPNPHILSTSKSKDNGALTFEAVDWGELAKATIDAYADSHARGQYFGADESLITSTKASITAMGETFDKAAYESMDLSTLTKYPTTGYYRIYNPTRERYMGTTDGNPVTIDDATGASTVVRLEYDGVNKKYKIQMQGLELDEPTFDTSITLSADGGDFTAEGTAGIGAFKIGDVYVHAGNNLWSPTYGLLGYDAPSVDAASGWTITDATSVTINLNSDGASPTPTYYATLCLPFDATIGGANAYTLAESGSYLVPTAVINNEVPAGTPVLLKGSAATATATINTGEEFNSGSPLPCALTGTYLTKEIDGATDYVLGIDGGVVGFYHWNTNTLGANRAYFDTPAGVKGFAIQWDITDGIDAAQVENGQQTKDAAIYNLAGQRVSKAQKGIYIQNGKKMLVK